jgi:hypothetical protein
MMGTEVLRHAIAQEGLNGKPNSSGRWMTLCKGIQTPDAAIATAKNSYDVTCPDCARKLVEMGCGSQWEVDPKLAEYLKQIASGDHPPNSFVGSLGQ